jgi:hypothetical protein
MLAVANTGADNDAVIAGEIRCDLRRYFAQRRCVPATLDDLL